MTKDLRKFINDLETAIKFYEKGLKGLANYDIADLMTFIKKLLKQFKD